MLASLPLWAAIDPGYSFAPLEKAIVQKQFYTLRKEARIAKLKEAKGHLSLQQEFEFNQQLVMEYRKFKLDSAIAYARQNIDIAHRLGRKDWLCATQLQLVPLYSTSGLFREAEALLNGIDRRQLDNNDKWADYYEDYGNFYAHYAANHRYNAYRPLVEQYRDSLLSVLNPSSIRYRIALAEKNMENDRLDEALSDLDKLWAIENDQTTNHAMIGYLLGMIYMKRGDLELAKSYFANSAITDLHNSIKDNASIRLLAMIYYEAGDIDKAYVCNNSAVQDAIFCNAQFRTLLMSEVYNIINAAYQDKEATRKAQLQHYLVLISALAFFLMLAMLLVYRQMRRLARIKVELSDTTDRLAHLNEEITHANWQLQERNAQLSESNHVKEEYIAQFFDLCSTYISKLERYRIALNKKAITNQHDELFKMLKSTTMVDDEVEELYKIFDNVFLNLYPTFVAEFNALLVKDEQVFPKLGELLNTELRIFALIRLGITDSVKIAAFLRYSLSAIYNYRTRARNKAAVSRNEFEELVMKIGTSFKTVN